MSVSLRQPSMGKRARKRQNDIFRARVRDLLSRGLNASQIAKLTGKSYGHTKRIVEQEQPEDAEQ